MIRKLFILLFIPLALWSLTPQEALEKVKGLEGTWVNEKGEVSSVFKVVSNGSVVLEEMFPQTDHAMVNVYYIVGDNLVFQHFCALKNQPKMKWIPGKEEDTLHFTLEGGTNFDPKKDPHMHGLTLKIVGDKKIQEVWESWDKGKRADSVTFSLTKKE